MNSGDRLNQGISALADGECNELETERLLSKLRRSPSLRRRWEQTHTVRAVTRGERVDLLNPGFAEAISKALESEAHLLRPAQLPKTSRPAPGWLKPAAGFAIAASVALVSVLGLRLLDQGGPGEQNLAQTQVLVPQAVAVPAESGTRWNVQRAELEQRLNSYLLNHMEHAAMGEMQGMLPYSRLAGYDTQQSQ